MCGRTRWDDGRLTIESESDLGVVVFVSDLPDIERFGRCIRQEAEKQDDGVRWGKTLWMDLSGGINKTHQNCATSPQNNVRYMLKMNTKTTNTFHNGTASTVSQRLHNL